MIRRYLAGGVLLAAVLVSSIVGVPVAHADSTDGDIFYTTFSGIDRVFKRHYSFDGATLTYGADTVIASTTGGLGGADGLLFDPTDPSFLLVGGQNDHIYRVDIGTGLATASDPTAGHNFHLAITPGTDVLGFGTEDGGGMKVNLVGLTPFNTGNTTFSVAGDDLTITGIAFDGAGTAYYTSSVGAGDGGAGDFGTATEAGGVITTHKLATVDAAHGIAFDPFTGDLILVGDNKVSQYHPGTGFVSTFTTKDNIFDQGAVDGKGHLFAASNTGSMLFIDYASSGLVGGGSNVTDLRFFRDHLDDVAPLSGKGSRPPVIPEPTSMLLFGLGGLGVVGTSRRKQLRNSFLT